MIQNLLMLPCNFRAQRGNIMTSLQTTRGTHLVDSTKMLIKTSSGNNDSKRFINLEKEHIETSFGERHEAECRVLSAWNRSALVLRILISVESTRLAL